MGMTNFKKLTIVTRGILSLYIALALGLSRLMMPRFTVKHGAILKKTEENEALIERKLLDADTPWKDKEFLLGIMTLYSLGKKFIEYYKTDNI